MTRKRRPTSQAAKLKAALRKSAAGFDEILDSALDAVITMDASGIITGWNPQAERVFGWSQREAIGRTLASTIIPPQYRDAHGRGLERFLATGEGPLMNRRIEITGLRRDGREFPVELTVTPLRSDDAWTFSAFLRDITERKQADEALSRLVSIVESSDDAIISKTLEGVIQSWNSAAERLFGYAAQEVIGQPISILVPSDRPDEVPAILERLKRGERVAHFETVRRRKDGREIPVSLTISPIRDAAGTIVGASAISRDITERKQAEEQLRQLQKMEAVGRLAGGVAHDFNNIMTAILGFSEVMLVDLEEDHPLRRDIEEIRNAGQRAVSLTEQLLAFSRKQILAPQVLDLNALVAEMRKMLRRLIGEDIELVTMVEPALDRVKADPGQLQQVIANLAVNARDAMPKGGKLTIETRNVELDEAYARNHAEVMPGRYVMLAVSDTGTGMDEETKTRLFEPFFTTKEQGKGTGLGLATVYGIVKQSGGSIWVYSEPEHGTTFKIYLPQAEETAEQPAAGPTARSSRGSETVLLVEDEDAVRALARRALETKGYTVLDARNGEEALRICQRHASPIHVLVTDVVMPRMSGRELADRLAPLGPNLKVLYMSGYTDDAIVHHGVLDPGVDFLQKPFTPDALARKLREVLDGR